MLIRGKPKATPTMAAQRKVGYNDNTETWLRLLSVKLRFIYFSLLKICTPHFMSVVVMP